jgi:hypothetical protein
MKAPKVCPECGFDLEGDGYPLAHRKGDGEQCEYRWDGGSVDDYDWS